MKALAFDFETTNKEYGSPLVPENRIVMVAWSFVGSDKVFDYYGPDILEARGFWDAVEEADLLVAQNAKFEAGWLLRLGYDPTEKAWWDTMLAERVKAGNRPWRLGLGHMAPRYGFAGKETRVDTQMKAGVCPSDIDPRYLRARCRRDTATTGAIYAVQHKEAMEQGWAPVVRTRCMLTPILAVIEANGMCLDPARVEEEYVKARTQMAELDERLKAIAGGTNLNSPKQKAALFYDVLNLPERVDRKGLPVRTAKGERKTDKGTVQWLQGQAKTPEQKAFFTTLGEHAKVSALLSKNLEFFHGVATERPGAIFYGNFTQHITATHRLSGTGRPQEFRAFPGAKSVQFQNMPRRLKRIFKARDSDYVMVEADGSQLEFRVAAFLGQDRQAMADIVDPRFDAHVTSASHMFQRGYDELLEAYRAGDKQAATLRTAAKSECFPLDTEYLTPAGWKLHAELQIGDAIIGYDAETGALVTTVVQALTQVHEAPVVELRTKHNWAVRSTADHRWYGSRREQRGSTRRYRPCVMTTEELNGDSRITVAAPFLDVGTCLLSPDDARRLAWLWGDGSISWSTATKGPRRGVRAVVVQGKAGNFAELDRLFGAVSIPHNANSRRWPVLPGEVRRLYEAAGHAWDSTDYEGLVLRMSPEARTAWLDAMIAAEGTPRKNGEVRLAQNAGPLADAIRLAAYLTGHDTRVVRFVSKLTGVVHEQITRRKKAHVGGARLTKRLVGEQAVACVKTGTDTVVIRQCTGSFSTITISGNTFKPLYGGSKGTDEQERWYTAFRERYAELYATQESWLDEVLASSDGALRTDWGMTFYWDYTLESRQNGRTTIALDRATKRPIKQSVFNYPVQSLATAEIIPIALTALFRRCKRRGLRVLFVNTVHDSVVAEVHKEDVEAFIEETKPAFTTDVFKYLARYYRLDFNVPLGCEVKWGPHWGEGEEIKHDADPAAYDKRPDRARG